MLRFLKHFQKHWPRIARIQNFATPYFPAFRQGNKFLYSGKVQEIGNHRISEYEQFSPSNLVILLFEFTSTIYSSY